MLKVYFDSGTTNTRVYFIDENGKIVWRTEKEVGSKDAAVSGDKELLPRELSELLRLGLDELGIVEDCVESVWMSGMITSPNGIVEVPHISVPVDAEKLASRVFKYNEEKFFKREINFIAGIKTVVDGTVITPENVAQINNMRGEETEICGIIDGKFLGDGTSVLIMPGSHTQIAVVKDGKIVNIISTITGELFKALKTQTILSASLEGESPELDEKMVKLGYKNLVELGFNRAIYIDRSMLLFTDSTAEMRHSYLEGVLNGGVLQAICAVLGKQSLKAYVCGSQKQFRIIKAIAEDFFPEYKVEKLENSRENPFSVMGFKAIYRQFCRLQADCRQPAGRL